MCPFDLAQRPDPEKFQWRCVRGVYRSRHWLTERRQTWSQRVWLSLQGCLDLPALLYLFFLPLAGGGKLDLLQRYSGWHTQKLVEINYHVTAAMYICFMDSNTKRFLGKIDLEAFLLSEEIGDRLSVVWHHESMMHHNVKMNWGVLNQTRVRIVFTPAVALYENSDLSAPCEAHEAQSLEQYCKVSCCPDNILLISFLICENGDWCYFSTYIIMYFI